MKTRLLLAIGCSVMVAAGCSPAGTASRNPTTHTYFIAADEVVWDYAPSGMNQIRGEPFGEHEAQWMERGPHTVGGVYKKALYREYTDATFTTLKPRPPEWEHLGFLGPLIRAEVGDTIRVIYRNNVSFRNSLHPHGVFYEKSSEGAPYQDQTDDAQRLDDGVPAGETVTYTWPVPERAGPAQGDPSSILWMYHSHTSEIEDVNAGLMGPMIISASGTTKPDGTPQDVDRELVVSFHEVFENESWYLRENLDTYLGAPDEVAVVTDPFGGPVVVRPGEPGGDFNLMESMNGFVYGNLQGLTMKVGERVRWYLMGSTNFEFHSPHWHGNTVTVQNMRTDVTSLLPMGMLVADMIPDNPGVWLFHCHNGPHLKAGMESVYTVLPTDGSEVAAAQG